MFPEAVYEVYGFLSPAEMELLYTLAQSVPPCGTIVEIGSFQGKSTVCLGLGAKLVGAWVYAIDPHEDYQATPETHYGMENHAALLKNLVAFDIADTVRVIALDSMSVVDIWDADVSPIDLLWIDGSHDFRDVHADLFWWSKNVADHGKIAMHDTSGHFPDVSKALQKFLSAGKWVECQHVDATTVMERVHV